MRQLSLLTGLGIVAVVINHAAGSGLVAMFWWAHRFRPVESPNFDQLGSVSYLALRTCQEFGSFAVPTFMFVTGYFAAYALGNYRLKRPWPVVLNRIKYLLIPYIIWSAAAFASDSMISERRSIPRYIRALAIGDAMPAYYFVPVLILCYLLSPLIVRFAISRWRSLLALAFIIQFGRVLTVYPSALGYDLAWLGFAKRFPPIWSLAGNIFWFCLGMVFGIHLRSLPERLVHARRLLLVICGVLLIVSVVEWEVIMYLSPAVWLGEGRTVTDELYAMSFILLVLSLKSTNLKWSKQLNTLSANTYGIYLSHVLVLLFVSKVIYHVAPVLFGLQLLYQMILVLLGIGVPLFLMYLLKHSRGSRYYRYVFG